MQQMRRPDRSNLQCLIIIFWELLYRDNELRDRLYPQGLRLNVDDPQS